MSDPLQNTSADNAHERALSRERRVQLTADQEATFAQVDHLANQKQAVPREVLELQEEIFKLRDENAALKKDLDMGTESREKREHQLTALELFSSDLQRKYDKLEHAYNKTQVALHELTGQDWAKRVIGLKEQVKTLQRELVSKDDALEDLKKRVSSLLQKEDAGAHYSAFFERQSQDLIYA